MLYRPLFLATALAAFVAVALLPDTAAAGAMSRVIELKSKSEDARRIVADILEKEADRLDRCGEKYMAAKPKGPFLVQLKIRLSPQEAQVLPVKASDAKHPGVACVGSVLAGVRWPKPSGKIDVVAEILLGRMKGPTTKDQDLDLDEDESDWANDDDGGEEDEARAEEQRKAEARAEKQRRAEAQAEEQRKAEARAEKQRRAEAQAEEQRRAEAQAEEQRRAEARAEKQRKAEARAEEQRRAEAREREHEAKARAEKQRRAEAGERKRGEERRRDSSGKPGGSSVRWRTAQVGYIANSVEGGLSKDEVAREIDNFVLPKIGKAWRRARAFNAMVRLRIFIGAKGQVKKVDILKSSDAADFQDEVVHAVKAAEWPASEQGLTIEWTFAFKR